MATDHEIRKIVMKELQMFVIHSAKKWGASNEVLRSAFGMNWAWLCLSGEKDLDASFEELKQVLRQAGHDV